MLTVDTSPFNATFVPGACARPLSASITCCRFWFNDGVRFSVCVPASIAGTNAGNASFKDAVAGVIAFPNVVRSTKNGCWTFSDSVDTASVDGDFAIVACKFCGSLSIAANVVAICVNRSAFTCATGATAPMNRSRLLKNGTSCVLGSDRYFATGCKCKSSGGRLEIVSFNADPRAVNASPAPARLSCTATRVFGIKRLEHVIKLHRHARLPQRQQTAIGDRVRRRARVQIEVLGAKHRRRLDRRGRVDRDARVGLIEVEDQLRADLAARKTDRLHVADHADPEATRTHVVADHQVEPFAMSTFSSLVGTNGSPVLAL